ncbi:MAG: NUDIX domain-containing protein, partial [Verrucomicrobiaceae bacterium]
MGHTPVPDAPRRNRCGKAENNPSIFVTSSGLRTGGKESRNRVRGVPLRISRMFPEYRPPLQPSAMPASRKAAAVCYRLNNAGEPEFLLVRNTANTQWVFPKGTMEAWEAFGYETAARETWEEAGARGVVEARCLGVFQHRAWLKKSCEWATQ